METTQKKGIQLNEAVFAVGTLISVALLVIVGVLLIGNLDTAVAAQNTPVTVVNETSNINKTGDFLNRALTERDFNNAVVVVAINGSSGAIIPTSNYTVTANGFLNSTTAATNWVNVNVTYTYTYTLATAASNASTATNAQFSGYPALVGLVGTIIFLGLVVGALMVAFLFGKAPSA